MERGFEQLVIMAVIVLAGMFDLLVRWVKGKQRKDAAAEAGPGDEQLVLGDDQVVWQEEADNELPADIQLPTDIQLPEEAPVERRLPPTLPPVPVVSQPPSPPPTIRPRRVARRLLTHPLDARRGIVMMTVLGPCRGVQLPDGNA